MRTVQNRIARTALLTTILAVAFATQALAASSKDEDAIKARVAEFIAAMNKGDAKAMAAFWTEDAMLVNPAGVSGKGPAEIEKIMDADVNGILKGAKMEMKVVDYRPAGKDAAWVELEHSVTGAMTPDGKPMPPMTFHVPALLVKKGKTWMIAEARPYAYLPPHPGGKPAMAPAAMAAPPAPAKK
jgi:uncharacterized protein (TIGR02246 family)